MFGRGRLVCDQHEARCVADDGRIPRVHGVDVREVRLAAGAGFVVAICGEIMTMPGLPKVPSADSIDVGADGKIVGLF